MIIDNRFGKKSEGFTKKFPFVVPSSAVNFSTVGMKVKSKLILSLIEDQVLQ